MTIMPVSMRVQALTLLEDLGALVPEQQALTPLGRHLAALPLPPRMGKLLLYAIMFACLDPLLTVACFAAFRCRCSPLRPRVDACVLARCGNVQPVCPSTVCGSS